MNLRILRIQNAVVHVARFGDATLGKPRQCYSSQRQISIVSPSRVHTLSPRMILSKRRGFFLDDHGSRSYLSPQRERRC